MNGCLQPGTLLVGRFEVREPLGPAGDGQLYLALSQDHGRLARLVLLTLPASSPPDLRGNGTVPMIGGLVPPLVAQFAHQGEQVLALACPGGCRLADLDPVASDEPLLAMLCELAAGLRQLTGLGAGSASFTADRVLVLPNGALVYVGPVLAAAPDESPLRALAAVADGLRADDCRWTVEVEALLERLRSADPATPMRAVLGELLDLVGDGELSARAAVATDPGPVRLVNEDAALAVQQSQASDDGLLGVDLLVVTDGMGGHRDGARAAQLAATTFHSGLAMAQAVALASGGPFQWHHNEAVWEAMDSALGAADETVAALGEPGEGYPPASTLVAALRVGRRLFVRHVGDSRCYLQRGGRLERLTRDDSVVQGLVDRGHLRDVDMRDHPDANLVTRYVGSGQARDGVGAMRLLQAGDRVLLCSDGVSAVLDDQRLGELLDHAGGVAARAEAVVTAAHAAGSRDNITAALLELSPASGAGAET